MDVYMIAVATKYTAVPLTELKDSNSTNVLEPCKGLLSLPTTHNHDLRILLWKISHTSAFFLQLIDWFCFFTSYRRYFIHFNMFPP